MTEGSTVFTVGKIDPYALKALIDERDTLRTFSQQQYAAGREAMREEAERALCIQLHHSLSTPAIRAIRSIK